MHKPVLEDLLGILAALCDLIDVDKRFAYIPGCYCARECEEEVLSGSSCVLEHEIPVELLVSCGYALLEDAESISYRAVSS